VQEEAALALDLPRGPASPSPHAAAIAAFAATAPKPAEHHGWQVVQISREASGASGRSQLSVEIASKRLPFRTPELVAEATDGHRHAFAPGTVGPDKRRVRFVLALREDPGALEGAQVLALTLFDGSRSGTFFVRTGASN
jgi:hypothetical protein